MGNLPPSTMGSRETQMGEESESQPVHKNCPTETSYKSKCSIEKEEPCKPKVEKVCNNVDV